MSYVTVGNEKLGSVTLPSDAHGHSGSMSVETTNQHPLSTSRQRMFPLAMVALLAAAFGFNPGVRAQDVAPPISGVLSSVNLDANGNPDPYFVSIDLLTAQHPQTLLATHLNGQPLAVEHGAPLRLLVPVKLGLKNIKAITRITYTKDEPPDYWAKRGYSRYDGI